MLSLFYHSIFRRGNSRCFKMALDNESFQLQKNLLMQLGHDRSRKCRFCRRSFKYQFSLIQHLKEFHKEEMAVSSSQINSDTKESQF